MTSRKMPLLHYDKVCGWLHVEVCCVGPYGHVVLADCKWEFSGAARYLDSPCT